MSDFFVRIFLLLFEFSKSFMVQLLLSSIRIVWMNLCAFQSFVESINIFLFAHFYWQTNYAVSLNKYNGKGMGNVCMRVLRIGAIDIWEREKVKVERYKWKSEDISIEGWICLFAICFILNRFKSITTALAKTKSCPTGRFNSMVERKPGEIFEY